MAYRKYCRIFLRKNFLRYERKEVLSIWLHQVSLTELVIEDPKKAEAFINALELSSQDPVWKPFAPSIPILGSVEESRRFLGKKRK